MTAPANARFPGIDCDGSMAELLLTSARSVVKLSQSLHPAEVAALADAGLTAYHAVRKAQPLLHPGTSVAVIGAGGLGHIGVQCLAAMTPAEIIVVDRSAEALKLAEGLGATHTVPADGRHGCRPTSARRTSPTSWSRTPWTPYGRRPECGRRADGVRTACGRRRRGIEGNAGLCRGLLRTRYGH
ncbi:MDR/zinc-dependent alcohol dehydrogenase-like family protein [Nonomuraea gerenzanensis]|uniref:alcohol dehydrogenase n=1 Tax=Nonomuraea gerenzanensis TaxID=93944 RepID=A0A1M4EQW9_9ACTN|nr:hypothetical protein [Nonomuraea gerenzanensis]UBU12662.1 hypothetical protein LCN96_51805 [Nonomuraea gerenzanensis]SBP01218.1 alcohol dehydrogenase [Nonomuraea gerenzanensis]